MFDQRHLSTDITECSVIIIAITFLLSEDGSVAIGNVVYQTLSELLPNNTIKYVNMCLFTTSKVIISL